MNTPLVAGLAALAGIVIEGCLLFLLVNMLKESGAVRKNFQGIDIPVSAGLSFPMTVMLVFIGYRFFSWYDDSYQLFIFGLMSISFLGFIDDMLGQRDTLGFKGHLGSLARGKLTTGGLKALGGGMIAFFLSLFIAGNTIDIIINTLVMALFTNMLNLLDLRPGRAVKGFIFFVVLLVVLAAARVDWLILAPLFGAVLYYFRLDLKAQVMMGDAGSNVLGLALGFIAATNLNQVTRIGILVFLIAIHIYTEKYSLTDTINRVRLLRVIDQMGRRVSND
ncbi:MAG: hypothetical protein ACOX6I_06360 [Syntrophomonadaceae bacterium]